MASLKLDENLPAEATELLQNAGHDAMSVWDQSLEGHSDDSIASVCQSEKRAIVTFDLDFADIRAYPPEDHFGIVVLRLRQQDKPHVLQVIEQLLPKLDDEPLVGKLWIVAETTVRIWG